MKIKQEYINCTISHKGNKITLDPARFEYFQSIGLGHFFEESTVSEPKVIKYKAVKPKVEDTPIPDPEDGTEEE